MTENLHVEPSALDKASAGINGVIDGLADTGVGSDYSAALGRGYGDLDLDGRTIGHADPKSGLEEYCDRWEWGVRALVTGAAELSRGLGLGASHYEREEKWAGDQLKNYAMDVFGDPEPHPRRDQRNVVGRSVGAQQERHHRPSVGPDAGRDEKAPRTR
ncbi:ESX-1 secretion-associated protein [Gordonia hongkongensis]|uniref:ESX-1 secretion-associated protein n=1 Tax=Gordonia hongkongensis TaxID=1701090 RepID=UPI001FFAC9E7|nr:ESX-1 secretion-associated protein [Gordonia hongkongensis]UPG66353.1 ESX-1 secretion-associated protein [Gordonia hongkongensis]